MKKVFNNPDSQEREYTRTLLKFTSMLKSDVNKVLIPKISVLTTEYSKALKTDGWLEDMEILFAELTALAGGAIGITVTKLPSQFNAVSNFNEGQFAMVVKANTGYTLPKAMVGAPKSGFLGVNVFRSEPFLSTLSEGWIAENTALIKSIPSQMHSEIRGVLQRGLINGQSVSELKSAIKERYDVTDNRAALIAQDQTLKLNANLTEYRMLSVGVKKYIWRTVHDSRVRQTHAARDGKEYSFGDGNLKPGEAVRCRCRAEGIFEDR